MTGFRITTSSGRMSPWVMWLRCSLCLGNLFRKLGECHNLIDYYNRQAIGLEADFYLPAELVIRELKHMISWRGQPLVIFCYNGSEYISAAIQNWTTESGVRLEYIQPSNPQQNAYVERFNRTVRYKWLSQYYWTSLEEVQKFAPRWMCM